MPISLEWSVEEVNGVIVVSIETMSNGSPTVFRDKIKNDSIAEFLEGQSCIWNDALWFYTVSDQKFNPGCAQAVSLGCTCPVMDNCSGLGRGKNGVKNGWVMSGDCDYHNIKGAGNK